MHSFRTLDDLDVAGKRVLLRGDLNVPVDGGRVTDATRLDRLAPTIAALTGKGARVIVMSHFGRPKGQVVPDMSLRFITEALSQSLGGVAVDFAPDCIGEAAQRVVDALPAGAVAVLENLRFHAGEEANDPDFAGQLAALGDAYVNDAFSAAHRAHASTEGLAHLLPAAAGLLMQAELEALSAALEKPKRPVAAIVGGSKISTKLDLLGNLVAKVQHLIIGGAMANTFLNAMGTDVGKSLCEYDLAGTANDVLATARAAGCNIVLPVDALVAAKLAVGVEAQTVAIGAVPADRMILDVGPQTAASIIGVLGGCPTLVWNGPLGAFEVAPFDRATNAVAVKVAELTEAGHLNSVAGGGDTVAALRRAGVLDRLSYVSTAGGAFLEWLEGKTLPGVAALQQPN